MVVHSDTRADAKPDMDGTSAAPLHMFGVGSEKKIIVVGVVVVVSTILKRLLATIVKHCQQTPNKNTIGAKNCKGPHQTANFHEFGICI